MGLLTLAAIWYFRKIRTDGLAAYDLIFSWGLKMVAGCIFLFVYTYYYAYNTLTADPQSFMAESKMLHDVANESFADYLRFLFNFDTPELIQQYLSHTTHWTVGDLTLINDSRNVIRVNSLIWFVSNGNVYAHVVIMGFFSLLGFRELYLGFCNKIHFSKRLFWYILILFPSLIFWTGSMLKEPLMIVGLCLALRALFDENLSIGKRTFRWLVGIFLMLLFKPYILICLLIAAIVYYSAKWFFRGKAGWSALSILGITAILLLILPSFRQKSVDQLTGKQFAFMNVGKGGVNVYADTCFFYFRPDQLQYLRVDDSDSSVFLTHPLEAKHVALGHPLPVRDIYLRPNKKPWLLYYRSEGSNSYIEITFIDGSLKQLLYNIPEALTNAAFRPFFGDPGGWLKYFAIVETLLFFGWIIYAFRWWKHASRETRLIVATLWIFAIVLLLLIGWTTPVLGAIVRYRIPAYLAILLASLLLVQKRIQVSKA
jgi:hypothetical protein